MHHGILISYVLERYIPYIEVSNCKNLPWLSKPTYEREGQIFKIGQLLRGCIKSHVNQTSPGTGVVHY